MIDLALFHFLRPWWLLLLLPALVLLWWPRAVLGSSAWKSVIDTHLQPFLLVRPGRPKISNLERFYRPLFVALLAFALAGPTFNKLPNDSDLIKKPLNIVLDLSHHMLSTDISPTRLKRAIFKVQDLLRQERGREIALIAFAGDAHVVVPLTQDHATLLNLLESLSPELMPMRGANLVSALNEARSNNAGSSNADILVITSTNIDNDAQSLIDFAEKNQTKIFLWAFATESGAPLLNEEGQFARGRQGGINISALKTDWLGALNRNPWLKTFAVTADDKDVKEIVAAMSTADAVYKGKDKENYDTWYDLGPYFLAMAMALFLWCAFHRGPQWWILGLLITVQSPKAEASFWQSLFKRGDQRAHQALLSNEPEQAAELYQDDFGKGTSLYKAKNYEEAAKYLSRVHTSDGQYNLGNSYAHLGRNDEAIKAYDEALRLNEQNNDARFNKELLEKLKQEQKQEQKQQQDSEQNKPENKDNGQEGRDQSDKSKDQKPSEPNKQSEQKQADNEAQADEKKTKKGEEEKEAKEQGKDKQEDAAPEQKDEKPSPQPVKPKEGEEGPQSKDSPLLHHLDHQPNKNLFLKRKFHSETRKKQGAQP